MTRHNDHVEDNPMWDAVRKDYGKNYDQGELVLQDALESGVGISHCPTEADWRRVNRNQLTHWHKTKLEQLADDLLDGKLVIDSRNPSLILAEGERWRASQEFPIEVSDLGRVRHTTGVYYIPQAGETGILTVKVTAGSKRIKKVLAKLVKEAFGFDISKQTTYRNHNKNDCSLVNIT